MAANGSTLHSITFQATQVLMYRYLQGLARMLSGYDCYASNGPKLDQLKDPNQEFKNASQGLPSVQYRRETRRHENVAKEAL
jgi:hypothetical protein